MCFKPQPAAASGADGKVAHSWAIPARPIRSAVFDMVCGMHSRTHAGNQNLSRVFILVTLGAVFARPTIGSAQQPQPPPRQTCTSTLL
jgi:hypothetical protein